METQYLYLNESKNMTNIKIEFTDSEFIANKKYNLILKANYSDYDRLYEISYNNKLFLIYALSIWFFYAENNWFLYLTNWKDTVFQINIKDFSIKTFESNIFIFSIFFYKNFIIIWDEISIYILNEKFEKIKEITTEPIWIINNCFLENEKIIYFDEENNKFEFELGKLKKV